MDIEQARTFLAVYETGTFNRAADKLHVTQSTVSTRIMALEEQLGRALFTRSRAGTELTAAGRQFHPHAANLVRIWQQARQELVLPATLHTVLAIGGQYSLWDELLAQWLPWMRANLPDVAVRAEIATPDMLTRQVLDGTLDLAVMYMPQNRSGLVIDRLLDDKIVLVSSEPAQGGPQDAAYVYIDWGSEFASEHAMTYADAPAPAIAVSHGMLGLTHILEHGGSGYFPKRLVRAHLQTGALHQIDTAPTFLRSAYVVYPAERRGEEPFALALDGLKRIALGG